jgi:hypothetical protein
MSNPPPIIRVKRKADTDEAPVAFLRMFSLAFVHMIAANQPQKSLTPKGTVAVPLWSMRDEVLLPIECLGAPEQPVLPNSDL